MSAVQPQPVPPMTVAAAGGNRNAKNLPYGAEGRDWSHGLFGCLGAPGTCLVSWFCPCITYAKIKRRYEHLNTKGVPDPEQGGCCSTDCMLHGCITLGGCGWVMQFMLRGSVRERYHISGGSVGDCCAAACCTPCELTQESREIELEEASFGKY